MQGAKFLATFLNDHDDYEKGTDHIFKYKHLGMLAYIGGNKALADLPFSKTSGFSTWRILEISLFDKISQFQKQSISFI